MVSDSVWTKIMATLSVVCVSATFALPATAKPPAKRPAAAHAAPASHAAAPAAASTPAAKAPSGQLNGAYTAYINRLRGKLDHNWYLPDGNNKVTLSVDLAPDGSVTNLNVSSAPSSTLAEQAANDAFNQSQPLEALPATSPAVKLTLTFTSTADPHGDNTRSISGQIESTGPQAAAPVKKEGDSGSSSGSSGNSDSESH